MCFGIIDARGSENSEADMDGDAFPVEVHLWVCTEPPRAAAHTALLEGTGRWQTFPWRDRWQPGHPSPLMQGFLCIWELMRVWPCFYQLCNSACSKWVKKKIMAPQSGLAQSASWVQIVLGEENAAGKNFPLMLEDLSPRTFFKVLNTAQITWAGGQPVCLIWSQKDMIQHPCG